jgi:hypothetical protein
MIPDMRGGIIMVRDQLMQWLKPLLEQGVEIPTMAYPFRADIICWKGDRVMVVEVGIKVSRDDAIPTAPPEFTIAPLRRFPPLREGNRAGVRFPLLAGGTCRRGSSTAVFL